MSDLKDQIKVELDHAARLNFEARAHRRRAGEFLEIAREERRFDLILRGLDGRAARYLQDFKRRQK